MKGLKQEMPGEKPDFNNNHMTPNFLKMNKKNVAFEEITVIMPTNCLSQNGLYNPL